MLPEPALPAAPAVVAQVPLWPEPRLRYIIVGGPICGYGGFSEEPRSIPGPDGLIQLFGGEAAFRALLLCRTVEIARIGPSQNFDGWVALPVEIESAPIEAADVCALLAVVTRDSTYYWHDFDPERAPDFKFRLKFHTPEGLLFADLSFDDRIIRIVRGELCLGLAHFEFGRDGLAGVIDHYFPGALRLGEDL